MERQAGQSVVLLTPGGVALGPLLRGLKSRGGRPHVVSHPAHVMSALARLDSSVLLIDQPDRVERLGGLLAAVRRYYPRVRCWRYDVSGPGGRAVLSRVNGESLCQCEGGVAAAVGHGRVADGGEPSNVDGRIRVERAGAVDEGVAPVGRVGQGSVVPVESCLPEPMLTQEELMMLIGRASDSEDEPSDPDVNYSQ